VYVCKGFPCRTDNESSVCPTSRALALLAKDDIVAPILTFLGALISASVEPVCTASVELQAHLRVKNYSQKYLRDIFVNQDEQDDANTRQFDMIGLSQTTFNPTQEEDDPTTSNPTQEEDDPGDRCPHSNPFQADDDHESEYVQFERDLRTVLSLYKSLTSADRDCAQKSITTLISEMRGNITKNYGSVGKSVGTQGIVVERHNKRMRSYNTHHAYYK
jgi:hypothetical protein